MFVSTVFHLSVLRMLCVLFGFFIIFFLFIYLFVSSAQRMFLRERDHALHESRCFILLLFPVSGALVGLEKSM